VRRKNVLKVWWVVTLARWTRLHTAVCRGHTKQLADGGGTVICQITGALDFGGTALGLGCVAPAPMRLYPPSPPPREFCVSIGMRLLTPSMPNEEEGRVLIE
jgi:hypothetical protein